MKKLIAALLVILILVAAFPALAEEAPVLFDWTRILTDITTWLVGVIASAFLALLGYYGRKYAKPWLQETRLTALAQELVRAAEARFGRQQGEKKLHAVFDWLRDRGIDINRDEVIQAVMAAWQDLDLHMIEIGIKEPAPEHPPDAE